MSEIDKFFDLGMFEAAAKQAMPDIKWEWVAAGAAREITLRRNQAAFDEIKLHPRFMRDVSNRDLSTSLLGCDVPMPIFISSPGLHMNAHPEGELATVRGAGAVGAMMIVPASAAMPDYCPSTLGEIAAATPGPVWYQVYHQSREISERLIGEAEQAGYRAICFTVDVPVANWAESKRFESVNHTAPQAPSATSAFPVTLDDLKWFQSISKLPLVIKGIVSGEDARMAVEHGASGILVSNHGGRLLDTGRSTIEALPEVIDAVNGQAEVYLDSGVRRGTDVLKALAMGARAVGIGRPLFWGLATGGSQGVTRVLELLRAELDFALACCGQTSVRGIDPAIVSVPASWNA